MEFMKRKIYLQLLGEGGAGASAASSDGGAATGVEGASPVAQTGGDVSQVVYGKVNNQDLANPNDIGATNDITQADKQKAFDEMIKKGGEYFEEFSKRTQDIINKRFKETKGLEETLKSHESILGLLAAKYGVDANDPKALEDALNNDTALFEDAAFKEGLTPEQYRHKLQLEQENARLKAAQDEMEQQRGVNQIYSQWLEESLAVGEKYGVEIDLGVECQNPQMTQLLAAGVPFEGAYKVVHFDEMLGAGMAATASKVSEAMVNNIQSRSRRPAENGTQSASSTIFKADPSKFTIADLDEIKRRVAAGEEIAL